MACERNWKQEILDAEDTKELYDLGLEMAEIIHQLKQENDKLKDPN